MANLGNTIVNGILRVNGKINASDVISAPSFAGALTGNADTATKLKTARTINGVSFDGSANITVADSTKLSLAGGTMTGNISYNMNSSTQIPLKVYGGDVNGQGISVGAGGATIVGAGESAKACESLLSATTEQLWLTSDTDIAFITNCNTIGNRVSVYLSSSKEFYPNVNNTGTLGTSSYKWNNVYATTFTGALSGNASSATKLATARNINGVSFNGTANININKLVSIDVAGQTIDWNTYSYVNGYTEGIWNSSTDGGASNFTNLAVSGKSCRIELKLIRFVSTTDFIQVQEQLVGSTKTLYRRYNVSGTWSSWVTVSVNGVAVSSTNATNTGITATNPTSGTWYYPTWVTGTSGNLPHRVNDGYKCYTLEGTTSAVGHSYIQIGNATASGTAGNKQGRLRVYSASSGYTDIVTTSSTSNFTITLPAASGTVSLTSHTHSAATTSANGFMSSADKTKLNALHYVRSGTAVPDSSLGENGDIYILLES